MKTLTPILLAGAAFLAAGTGAASAADMLPVDMPPIYTEAPELTPVEIGNGWYLRGDVSYDLESETSRSHRLIHALSSADYQGNDVDIDESFGGAVGVGYQFTDMLRGDVTARYSKSDIGGGFTDLSFCAVGSDCQLSDSAEMTNWEVMGNAYADLGTFAGFTPYVGAGAGAVRVDYADAALRYCDNTLGPNRSPGCASFAAEGEKDWRFAYSLMAGLSYDVSTALKLDVGYRYLDVDGGDAYEKAAPLLGDPDLGFAAKDDGFQRHSVQAGLRYSLF